MSFDQLSNLESGRRGGYADDPAFQELQYDLKSKLQALLSSNRKLANDVNVLGTKKDTPRLRERVHNSMEKTREMCQAIGEGVKRLQTWEDLTVRPVAIRILCRMLIPHLEAAKVRADQGFERLPSRPSRIPDPPATSPREGARLRDSRPRRP